MNNDFLYDSAKTANNIKNVCKSKNVTIGAMLAACGLGSNAMSHMLHGRAIASDSLAKIADYLDCSVDYLLGRTDNPDVNR